jgi:hypothetical protein
MSAADIQAQQAEAAAMETAHMAADAESRKSLAQEEGQKIGVTYKPTYESVLSYVVERPFSP